MAVYVFMPVLKRYSGHQLVFKAGWPLLLLGSIYIYTVGNQFLALLAAVMAFVAVLWLSFTDGGLLNRKALVGLGNISYSMYLSHPFIMTPASRIWPGLGISQGDPWFNLIIFTVTVFGGCLLVSWLLYRWIETGFTDRFLKRYLR